MSVCIEDFLLRRMMLANRRFFEAIENKDWSSIVEHNEDDGFHVAKRSDREWLNIIETDSETVRSLIYKKSICSAERTIRFSLIVWRRTLDNVVLWLMHRMSWKQRRREFGLCVGRPSPKGSTPEIANREDIAVKRKANEQLRVCRCDQLRRMKMGICQLVCDVFLFELFVWWGVIDEENILLTKLISFNPN